MAEHNGLDGKLMTVGEAVERFVPDGCQIAVGGFTINRNPMAVAYEIARRRIKDLHLVAHSNGQALDVLVGAGCVSRLDIAYGGNGRFAPTCIRFRKAVERGELLVEDYTNNMMSLRFLAGALNVPFIPSKSGLGTDVVEKRASRPSCAARTASPARRSSSSTTPFGHEDDEVVLLPALTPDVSIIHAQQVSTDGTVRIKGLTFADLEQCKAATRRHRHLRGDRPRELPAAGPRPERPAALPGRRRGPGALRRPPHRLPATSTTTTRRT